MLIYVELDFSDVYWLLNATGSSILEFDDASLSFANL
jgi:hypothetical protein